MRTKTVDVVYFLLPLLLWPLTFIVFKNYFLFAMCVSTFVLALFSIIKYKERIRWWGKDKVHSVVIGIAAALLLYAVFFFGSYAAMLFGLGGSVQNVYSTIYGQSQRVVIASLLMPIGIFEEIYWRGGLQGTARKSNAFKNFPWAFTTLYYALVHVSTLSLVLVAAAFLVGLITGLVAERYGVVASVLSHVLWIEAIVVFFPL